MMNFKPASPLLLLLILLSANGIWANHALAAGKEGEAMEVEWDDLIPPDWRADPKLVELYQAGEIGDDDPRVIETELRSFHF